MSLEEASLAFLSIQKFQLITILLIYYYIDQRVIEPSKIFPHEIPALTFQNRNKKKSFDRRFGDWKQIDQ